MHPSFFDHQAQYHHTIKAITQAKYRHFHVYVGIITFPSRRALSIFRPQLVATMTRKKQGPCDIVGINGHPLRHVP